MLGHRFQVRQMHCHANQQRSCFLRKKELLPKVKNEAQHILAAD